MEEVKLEEIDPLEMEYTMDPLALDEKVHALDPISDDISHCCVVCNMLMIGFSKYMAKEQAEIINRGRPTPEMKDMNFHDGKAQVWHFNVTRYYNVEWLTGCEKRGRLFCWPCLLFSKRSDQWTTTGAMDLKNLSYMLNKHSSHQHHIEAVVKWKTFGKELTLITNEDEDNTEEELKEGRLKEEEVMKNREMLKKLITITCFISSKQLCSSEGNNELSDPIDQDKYELFLQFIGKYDEVLERQRIDNEMFLTRNIRDIVSSSISKVVTQAIVKEITQSNFVSMIMDEVAEMGDTVLVSTIVRYTTKRGEAKEKFLNFREIPLDRPAGSLFRVINENVQMLNCSSKCVSFSFDGGIVMTTELFKLQSQVKELCPNACFLHCCDHNLVSVLAQSLSTIKQCKHFFFTLNCLAANFFKSAALSSKLNQLIRKSNPSAADFRWHFNGFLIRNVCRIRTILIELFERITMSKEDWDFDIFSASSRFLNVLTGDLTFNFLLVLLGDIFLRADELSSILMSKYSHVTPCFKNITEYSNFIKKKKDTFQTVYNITIGLISGCGSSSKKIKLEPKSSVVNEPMEKCQNLFDSVISNIDAQLKSRFSDIECLNFVPYTVPSPLKLDACLLNPIINSFNCPFEVVNFLAEASVINEWPAFQPSSQKDTLKYIRHMDLSAILPQTVTVFELYLTLPLTKIGSTLERIETYVLSSTPAHRRSPLAILNIESDIVNDLLKQPQFYEDVIEEIKLSGLPISLDYDD